MRLTIRPVSPARCSGDGFEKYFVCVMLSASCLVTQHLKAVCYIIRFFIYPAHHFFITLLSFVRLFDTVTRVAHNESFYLRQCATCPKDNICGKSISGS
jgi:hypothetical protein